MASMKIDISEVVNGAIEKIKQEGYMVQKWIPCSERLPETPMLALDAYYTDDCLLVFAAETGWCGMAYYVRNGEDEWWEFADAQNKERIDWAEITHWMPLPEPPESEV